MLIRQAQESDCFALAELRWNFYEEDEDSKQDYKSTFLTDCHNFFQKSLSAHLWTHWVALDSDRVIAMVSLFKVENIPTPISKMRSWFYMTNVYTIPEKRKQGIASSLIEKCCSYAAEQGAELCIVWPDEQKTELYTKMGFSLNPYLLQRNLG